MTGYRTFSLGCRDEDASLDINGMQGIKKLSLIIIRVDFFYIIIEKER